jgi:hypothetical protein
MLPHPLTYSRLSLAAGVLLVLTAVALLWGLLILYGCFPLLTALADAAFFMGMLAVCGMLSWFFFAYIRVWQAQIMMTLLVQMICLGVCYTGVSLLELEDINSFGRMLPLRLTAGILCWVVLMQAYHILQMKGETQPGEEEKEKKDPAESLSSPAESAERIERISVKDGVRIHLVQIDELLYIQACGDYVTLFTTTGQYVKEQTMKYFDTHLPPASFVRIHRSTIVNTNQIMRVELFGKETYCVRLKNGVSLRISGAGYKLLKERLGL